jgi:hypothetical protein
LDGFVTNPDDAESCLAGDTAGDTAGDDAGDGVGAPPDYGEVDYGEPPDYSDPTPIGANDEVASECEMCLIQIRARVEVAGETVNTFTAAKKESFKEIFAVFLQLSTNDLHLDISSATARRYLRRRLSTKAAVDPHKDGHGGHPHDPAGAGGSAASGAAAAAAAAGAAGAAGSAGAAGAAGDASSEKAENVSGGIVIDITIDVHSDDDSTARIAQLGVTSSRLVGMLKSKNDMDMVKVALVEQHVITDALALRLDPSTVSAETPTSSTAERSFEGGVGDVDVDSPVPPSVDDVDVDSPVPPSVGDVDVDSPVPPSDAPDAPAAAHAASDVTTAAVTVGPDTAIQESSMSVTVIACASLGALIALVAMAVLVLRHRKTSGAKLDRPLDGSPQENSRSNSRSKVPSGKRLNKRNSTQSQRIHYDSDQGQNVTPAPSGSAGGRSINEQIADAELILDGKESPEHADNERSEEMVNGNTEAEQRRACVRASVEAEVETMRMKKAAEQKKAAAKREAEGYWNGGGSAPVVTDSKLGLDLAALVVRAGVSDATGIQTEFNGRTAVVKVLPPIVQPSTVRHRLDLWSRSCMSHPNLLPLLGAVVQVDRPVCLVYPAMTEGSLAEHLSDPSKRASIGWTQRLHVLQAVAKAVLFLHSPITPSASENGEADGATGAAAGRAGGRTTVAMEGESKLSTKPVGSKPVIVHGAIKAVNVLMDERQTQSHARLTEILLTADMDDAGLTVAGDTYAFGILLLEVLGGKLSPTPKAVAVVTADDDLDFDELDLKGGSEPGLNLSTNSDNRDAESDGHDQGSRPNGVVKCDNNHPLLVQARGVSADDFADSEVPEAWPSMVVYAVHSLAIRCTHEDPSKRPEFSTVLKGLELLTTATVEEKMEEEEEAKPSSPRRPSTIVVRI